MKSIGVFVGTRPDTLKLIPIIKLLKKEKLVFKLIISGQHVELIEKVLNEFSILPDYRFKIKRNGLNDFSGQYFMKLAELFQKEEFSITMVQGDTTTALVSAIASFNANIKVVHIEAGLRTGDNQNPFPEEMNRKLIGQIAHFNFAPSEKAYTNLAKEGISKDKIFITGNTIIDLVKNISKDIVREEKYVLITMHRRENWGKQLENACEAVGILSNEFSQYKFIFPVHPNPIVKDNVHRILKSSKVELIGPLDYIPLIKILKKSKFIITDSGGIQEEAGYLGIPMGIMRERTERPEVIEKGTGILLGTKKEHILKKVRNILNNNEVYSNMNGKYVYAYGKGNSSELILKKIKEII
ncbi:UDP-N-acetylglucosamine 2-epimerase (non-hydrolyzing) [bacterium]|nr:UDP-N-acetylglucosamine 2-epimerase (non-hydrolyzing) [bacterium]